MGCEVTSSSAELALNHSPDHFPGCVTTGCAATPLGAMAAVKAGRNPPPLTSTNPPGKEPPAEDTDTLPVRADGKSPSLTFATNGKETPAEVAGHAATHTTCRLGTAKATLEPTKRKMAADARCHSMSNRPATFTLYHFVHIHREATSHTPPRAHSEMALELVSGADFV